MTKEVYMYYRVNMVCNAHMYLNLPSQEEKTSIAVLAAKLCVSCGWRENGKTGAEERWVKRMFKGLGRPGPEIFQTRGNPKCVFDLFYRFSFHGIFRELHLDFCLQRWLYVVGLLFILD